jgi:hypothetical protein
MLNVDYCSMQESIFNVPLRVKRSLAASFLVDSEFRAIETQELIRLVRTRKNIYVTDRASAIAVLKGLS